MNRSEIIAQYVRINRKFELQFMPVIIRAINYKVSLLRDRLKSGGIDAARNFLHTDLINERMTGAVKDLYRVVGTKHAQITYSRLKTDAGQKGFGFNNEWAAFILNYLQRHLLDKITIAINDTTRQAMLKAMDDMVTEGLGVDQMLERLKDWPYARFQAARIVRTEVNRAANVGNKAQANTSEFQQMKEWSSVHDFRTRGQHPKDHANHIALDGVKINEDDQFTDPRNGDRLDFPGDPKASAASTVNCRCQALFTLKRDINGNPIPKRQTTTVIYPGQIRRRRTIVI